MDIEFRIEEVFNERDTKLVGITSDIEEAIKICDSIDRDYNVYVWVNGEFLGVYMDMDADEIRSLFH